MKVIRKLLIVVGVVFAVFVQIMVLALVRARTSNLEWFPWQLWVLVFDGIFIIEFYRRLHARRPMLGFLIFGNIGLFFAMYWLFRICRRFC